MGTQKFFRINCHVTLKGKEGTINERAIVTKVERHHVWVTNMNMPYSGTIASEKFRKKDVQL